MLPPPMNHLPADTHGLDEPGMEAASGAMITGEFWW
jgi:hypothetical protein